MKYKVSRSLLINKTDDSFVGFDLMNQSAFQVNPEIFKILSLLDDWRSIDEIKQSLPEFETSDIDECISELSEIGAVLRYQSNSHVSEERLYEKWQWGLPSIALHLSTRNLDFLSPDESERLQKKKANEKCQPELSLKNCAEKQITLPNGSSQILELMAKRRSVREVQNQNISINALVDCLFAGCGIIGEAVNCTGKLPLKMTPSGGGRNPYEAYAFIKNVEGIKTGIYHYSGTQHSLQEVECEHLPKASELLGGQDWADQMSVTIILVANFERTMWKYSDNNAYRVVLIEAGHIAQNILLAATSHGLVGCPTAALSHSAIETVLGIEDPTISPIYAVTIGLPFEAF